MVNYEDKLVTIFTPTYNRATFLPNIYQDLCKQKSQNFVWMIVDDGSTDDTEKVVRNFIAENRIAITYIKKENGGKYTAYNLAVKKCKTKLLFITMDSDDRLKDSAVSTIVLDWENNKNSDLVGMVYLCEDPDGQLLVSKYNELELDKFPSLQQATIKNWFKGEAEYIFTTEYLQQFLYPERKGEKFFNELYSYIQMTGKMLWNKKSIYVRAYQDSGITKNFLDTVVRSPLNYADYSNILSKYMTGLFGKTKYTFYYNTFSCYGGRHKYINSSSNPIMSWILIPIGHLASFLLKKKYN